MTRDKPRCLPRPGPGRRKLFDKLIAFESLSSESVSDTREARGRDKSHGHCITYGVVKVTGKVGCGLSARANQAPRPASFTIVFCKKPKHTQQKRQHVN